jgi:hypothetical protein
MNTSPSCQRGPLRAPCWIPPAIGTAQASSLPAPADCCAGRSRVRVLAPDTRQRSVPAPPTPPCRGRLRTPSGHPPTNLIAVGLRPGGFRASAFTTKANAALNTRSAPDAKPCAQKRALRCEANAIECSGLPSLRSSCWTMISRPDTVDLRVPG